MERPKQGNQTSDGPQASLTRGVSFPGRGQSAFEGSGLTPTTSGTGFIKEPRIISHNEAAPGRLAADSTLSAGAQTDKKQVPQVNEEKDEEQIASSDPRLKMLNTQRQKIKKVRLAPHEVQAYTSKLDTDYWELALEEHTRRMQSVHKSDYYHYTVEPQPIDDSVPMITWHIAEMFYSSAESATKHFVAGQERMRALGNQIVSRDTPTDQLSGISENILSGSYALERNAQAIIAAKATRPKQAGNLSPHLQRQLEKYASSLGTQKPPEFRLTLERYMPRFLTYPVPQLPGEKPVRRTAFGGVTAPSVPQAFLPENPAVGNAPLHDVFTSARALEAAGNEDLGYKARTWGITSVLSMENNHPMREGTTEFPFFTYVFSGHMAGNVRETSKNPPFRYEEELNTTLRKTFARLEDELASETPGPATEFVQKLVPLYPEKLPELVGRAIIKYAGKGDYDEVSLLRLLNRSGHPWAETVTDHAMRLPNRRVLTQEEAQTLAATLSSPDGEEIPMDVLSDAVHAIVQEDDSVTFKIPLQKLGITLKGGNATIEVDLDAASESIDAVLTTTTGSQTRRLPFGLSISGETDSMRIDTLEGTPLPEDTLMQLRDLAVKAIQREAQRHMQSQPKTKMVATASSDTPAPAPYHTPTLSREARKELYTRQKEAVRPKQKAPQSILHTGENVVFTAAQAGKTAESVSRNIQVSGLEEETVSRLLQEAKIDGITPTQLIQKMNHKIALVQANPTSTLIGKKMNMEHYGKRAHDISLWQISWKLDGGATALRIYLEDTGSNTYVLRGIMRKKSESEQTRFIGGIVTDILNEKN